MHAYEEGTATGTYVLDARVEHQALRVTVCDSGLGVHNTRADVHPSLGCGLYLIQTLPDSAEITSRPSGGTRIVMRFAMSA
jgi:anti-sigma regulatory factor (Ser/Thr protein kinase)